MGVVQSVNVGVLRRVPLKNRSTGIDKVPTSEAVSVSAPGPKGSGGSGVAGDVICDAANHGGDAQAVYAYAREDLDWWQSELDRPLRSGAFGENLTTEGLDVTGALIGEKWRIGDHVVLQVTGPRIPCAVFALWMQEKGWLKTFTRRARPGAYLRVVAPGEIRVTDTLAVVFRPDHAVTVGTAFRALTREPELLTGLLEAEQYLEDELVQRAVRREPFVVSGEVVT